jgi:hypothetical protein
VIDVANMQAVGWGLVGTATTMVARRFMRRALYTGNTPRLPDAARHSSGVRGLLAVAAAAGAMLAIADVLQDQRRRVAHRAAQ